MSDNLKDLTGYQRCVAEEMQRKRAELRDRFAMAALTGLLAGPRAYSREDRAANAWQEADAMLKARGDE